jgi:2,3-bisphosphoglycerate-independent phosphoglycerate mutase
MVGFYHSQQAVPITAFRTGKLMHVLLIFIDGIGLGEDDPANNPFAVANTPTLHALAGGRRWLKSTPRIESERAIFVPTDARFGVEGRPQSASGQAVILTGRNVSAEIGEHYGPKPNPAIRAILAEDNLYKILTTQGRTAALLDAYPPPFFAAIDRGKRLRSSIQEAAYQGNVPIRTVDDLLAGNALSADWTGQGWRDMLGYTDSPVFSPHEAGIKMADLARQFDFSLFSTWITDEIGHRGPFEKGVEYLELMDQVMAGVLETWRDEDGLVIITSDHGNMEDLSIRQHTENDVPTVIIGGKRHEFAENFRSLMDITPHTLAVLNAQKRDYKRIQR